MKSDEFKVGAKYTGVYTPHEKAQSNGHKVRTYTGMIYQGITKENGTDLDILEFLHDTISVFVDLDTLDNMEKYGYGWTFTPCGGADYTLDELMQKSVSELKQLLDAEIQNGGNSFETMQDIGYNDFRNTCERIQLAIKLKTDGRKSLKHTPGPWMTQFDGTHHYITEDKPVAMEIARVTDYHNPHRFKEQEANANLIANAPTLLLVAEIAFDAFNLDDLSSFTQEQKQALLNLHNAIQRAKL